MIDVAKVAGEALEWCAAKSAAHSLGLDFRRECEDEWSNDYAVFLVDIDEPDDSLRQDVREMVHGRFDGFKLVLGPHGLRLKTSLVLRCHQVGRWGLMFEAFRIGRSGRALFLKKPVKKAAKKVGKAPKKFVRRFE